MSGKSKALSAWLSTSPFDLSLEEKRLAFLDSIGVEPGSPLYDKLQPQLDEMFIAHQLKIPSPQTLDFSGQKCGASYISSSYVCRVGTGYYGMKLADGLKPQIEKALEQFEKSIQKYNPEAQDFWRQTLKNSVRGANENNRVDDAKKEQWYLRAAKNAKILADDGPPTKLMLKDGEEVPVSAHVFPFLSKSGNMMWKDPIQNMAFTKRAKGDMELIQNRVTFAAALSNGQVKAALEFYDKYKKSPEMMAKGPFGSAIFAKMRDVPDSEIEKVWSELSPKERFNLSFSGVDSVGGRVNNKGVLDPRSAHRRFFEEFPDQAEIRGKEVLKAYLSQTPGPGQKALSPWTGLPVEMPGVRGKQQSVVDHVTALSKFYPSDWTGQGGVGWTRAQGSKTVGKADVASNMVIGESGINNGRGASENWDVLMKGWARKQKDFEKHVKTVERLPTFNAASSPRSGLSGPRPAQAEKKQSETIRKIQSATVKNFTSSQSYLTQKRLNGLSDGELRSLLSSPKLYGYQRQKVQAVLDSRRATPEKAKQPPPNKSEAVSKLKDQVQRYRKQGMKDSFIKAQMQTILDKLPEEVVRQLF